MCGSDDESGRRKGFDLPDQPNVSSRPTQRFTITSQPADISYQISYQLLNTGAVVSKLS